MALRIRRGGAGGCLWHERAAAGDLRRASALVARTLPGHAPGILPAGEPAWPLRLLDRRALGADRDPLLPAQPAGDPDGDIPGPPGLPAHVRASLPSVCALRAHRGRRGAPGPVVLEAHPAMKSSASLWGV